MPSRALGALLAFAAALLFAVSLAAPLLPGLPAWWDGHPTVGGHVIAAKDVHIGLVTSTGCNTGGDGACETVEVGTTFKLVGYGELGVTGLAVVLALALAITAWRIGDRRKSIAKVAMVMTLVAAAVAGALIVLGPGIQASQQVDVPIGGGLMMFGGAVAATLLAGFVTRSLEREPLRLRTSHAKIPEPVFDVRQIIRDQHDGLRPTAAGAEPMLGATNVPGVQGSPWAHPAAPLVPGAPQLRPLYDPHNAGYVPPPSTPPLPTRAPTPMPRAMIGAITGVTPPPMAAVPPHVTSTPPPAAVLPPPDRSESQPIEPPPPRAPVPPLLPSSSPPPAGTGPRAKLPSAAPPPGTGPRTKLPSAAPPPGTGPRAKLPSAAPPPSRPATMPPPLRGKPATGAPAPLPPLGPGLRPPQPTISHAIPPPPTGDNLAAPSVLPASQTPARPRTETDDRLETAMRETDYVTAVEIDAEAKAAAVAERAVTARRREEEARKREAETAQLLEGTDTSPQAAVSPNAVASDGDESTLLGTGLVAPDRMDSLDESTDVRATPVPPRDTTGSQVVVEPPAEPRRPGTENGETRVREAQSPHEDLMETVERNPKPPPPPAPEPERSATQVPISTAPASLPPPKQTAKGITGPTPACPQCEAPMSWVDEHLRFYCRSCRMYF